jgi:hypothetical protein
LCSTINTTTD